MAVIEKKIDERMLVGNLILFVHGWCCFWLAPSVLGFGQTPATLGVGRRLARRRTGSRFR
jgi:hypothetical protein